MTPLMTTVNRTTLILRHNDPETIRVGDRVMITGFAGCGYCKDHDGELLRTGRVIGIEDNLQDPADRSHPYVVSLDIHQLESGPACCDGRHVTYFAGDELTVIAGAPS